jgi:hypothetical protein
MPSTAEQTTTPVFCSKKKGTQDYISSWVLYVLLLASDSACKVSKQF